jgi:ATP-binding cassette subfamily A (ABC1) protein 3
MSEGQLKCLGSSLFLKKTYGVGYQLTIEKHSDSSKKVPIAVQSEDGVDVVAVETDEKLQDIIECSVPDATLLTNVGTEMSFQLPLAASSNFQPMFEKLDAEVDAGGIVTYGVGVTTLDEVFLLVARGATDEKKDFASSKHLGKVAAAADDAEKSVRSRMDLDNEGLFKRHVIALFRKRAVNFKRDKKAWVCTTILPSMFVLIGFLLYAFVGPQRNLESLTLDLGELNVNIDSEPRNPISFNSGNSFSCQPGVCIYDNVVVNESSTRELYSYCGVQAYLGETASCSIQEYEAIVARITEGGAGPAGVAVNNISEVRAVFVLTNYRSSF